MLKSKTSLQFINHASILVKHGAISLLSDPWYQGDAFHKGWKLIHELKDQEINNLLEHVTHIWISHEHPDHFSILFFKKFGDKLKKNNIQILFQHTNDKRVENFLIKSNFNVKILDFNIWIKLSKEFNVLCLKDGFYDSGLAIKTADKTILNLNDCEINNKKRCKEILKITGECNILATQFSYASWKGGVENSKWRVTAAKEKIEAMKLQTLYFKPKLVVPFASYIYFSNRANYYLNDDANTPNDIVNAFENMSTKVKVMKPFQVIEDIEDDVVNKNALSFWNNAIKALNKKKLQTFELVSFNDLEKSFKSYQKRVFKNNSKWFIKLVSYLSPISAFKPIFIFVNDLNIIIKFDIFLDGLKLSSSSKSDISMSSESFNFILNNKFGFDTLTVNGCFEENSDYGFSRATRTLAIENLNNIGFQFRPSIIFNFQLIALFISRLWTVSKKINLSKIQKS